MFSDSLKHSQESTDPEAGRIIEAIIRSTRPLRMLEIGACRGDGAEVWVQTLQEWSGLYVGVELSQGNLEQLVPRLSKYSNAIIIPGSSQEPYIVERVSYYAPYSFVYINGSHRLNDAKFDIETYGDMLTPDGVIAVHDAMDFGFPKDLFPHLSNIDYVLIPTFRYPTRYGLALLQRR